MSTPSLSERVFYLIRFHDVELAEDFARRCPDAASIGELNNFFHFQFAQYPFDCRAMRAGLAATTHWEIWCAQFQLHVLPSLRQHRFPPMTHLHCPALYSPEVARAV